MGGVDTTILWDTGLQVLTAGRNWRKKYLPDAEVRPVKELLDKGEL